MDKDKLSCKLFFTEAAIRSAHCSRWELYKARLFGYKAVGSDGDVEVTCYQYKGKLYFWEASDNKSNTYNNTCILIILACVLFIAMGA